MQTFQGWHVDLDFDAVGSRTRASAVLRLPDASELRTRGRAYRHRGDPVQTRVGEELAAARALNDLARQLLAKASREIEDATNTPAHPSI